ncbi:porin [Candidatus Palauibacter sp.]|uniref:porin n=1 Tax=Candidatus Palauibacter sp. TaxID=3101350 RepID=UPI003AF1F4CD
MIRRLCAGTGLALGCVLPAAAVGQEAPPVDVGGLLRVGAHAQADSTHEPDGFRLFDARLRVGGQIGIVFDYYFQARYDADDDALKLWDAAATLPLIPEMELTFGLFKPLFGLEATQTRGALSFLDRSQASTAIAPGRQLGMQGGGSALDGRLTYGAGMFNGNGRSVTNDGDNYMFTSRVQFNSIGTVAFYDDLVVQAGASIGYSSDTSAPLGKGIVTGDPTAAPHITSDFAGDRVFWSADLRVTYRQWALTGEYLRAEYDLDATPGGGMPAETDAYGGYLELGYRAWGALEGVVRYDSFQPALGDDRDFMVFGMNVYPGYYARFSLQYASALNDSPSAPTLADRQFIFLVQVDF